MSEHFPHEHGARGDALDELRRKLEALPADDSGSSSKSSVDDPLASEVPAQIHILGDYELLEKIGEGGMGTVYLSRQRSLAGKRVALKILPPYFALDPRRIARFQNEARTAAKVAHPGIVTVLDIGEQDGVHFLVQELVPNGRTLAHWIDEHRRAPALPKGHYTAIAVLFAKVAGALQAVHAKHVIHRDIKPSNILLMPDDEPKVADFGLARDSEGIGLSTSGESPGTPSYKSPEHIDRRVGDVDARSDVFSLGATLYETLTFRRPFDGDSDLEIYSKICGQEVDDPRTVRAGIPAELALICCKALEKEPRRRYGSMAELAEDLARYVANRPIHAQPPSRARRLQLWAKRNVLATGLSAASLVVIATAATSVWVVTDKNHELGRTNNQLAVQTRAAEDNAAMAEANASLAREKERLAVASERRARKVTEFVENALKHSDPYRGGTQGYLVVDAMDEAIRELDTGMLKDDPETEASLQMTMASILEGNGRSADALELAKKALVSRRRLFPGNHPDVAACLNRVGTSLRSLGSAREAQIEFQEALTMLERLNIGDHADIAMELNNVASCLRILGQNAEALPMLEKALAMFERLFPGDHPDVAVARNNVAECLSSLGRFDAALQMHEAALAMTQRLASGDDPNIPPMLSNIAQCLSALNRNDEALLKFKAAQQMSKRLFPHDNPLVASCTNNVAECLKALGRKTEALSEFTEALAMRRRLFTGDHADIATNVNNIASCLRSLGQSEKALVNYEEALAMRQRLFPGDHPDVARSLNNVGFCLESLNHFAEALERHQAALAMRKRLFSDAHPEVASSLGSVSRCLSKIGRPSDALSMCQSALEMRERLSTGDDAETAMVLRDLAECLDVLSRSDEALPYAERASEMAKNVFPKGHPGRANSAATLDRIRQRLGAPAAPTTDERR